MTPRAIYTLDRQQSIVHVFDGTGKCVFKIDRRGQGSGEYPMNDLFPGCI
ncbi:MAG: 6-bladed beta-propeller [Tannerella sp.]|nr:6-bladed beta-propeller [Tannerella sp.]